MMLVTTTAVYGNILEKIKAELNKQGMIYVAELTTSTSVVVAGNSESFKCHVAREHGIPCVTPAWVLLGRCAIDRVGEFEVSRSLLGLEVCSTSLSINDCELVRLVCEAHRATYNAFLTLNCALLVVPNELNVLQENRKLKFAERKAISTIKYNQFMKRYSYAAEKIRSLLAIDRQYMTVSESMPKLVVYCSPASLVTEAIKSFLDAIDAFHTLLLTPLTTHVVILGQSKEVFSLRPGLEFVSRAWLEECAMRNKCVCVEPYRVKVAQCPIITFTGLLQKDRLMLQASLQRSKLSCVVREEFVLGKTGGKSNNGQCNTTHLVVRRTAVLESLKVAALCWHVHKLGRNECFLVDLEWVGCSIEEGMWLDCSRFLLELPALSAFRGTLMRRTHTASPAAFVRVKERDDDSDERTNLPGLLSKDAPSGSSQLSPLKSLEMLIEGLESKRSDYDRLTTAPITAFQQVSPSWRFSQQSSSKDRVYDLYAEDHSCAQGLLPFSSIARNCSSLPMESQLIRYREDNFDCPLRSLQKQEQISLSSWNEKAATTTVCPVIGGATVIESRDRHCCIMIAKSLHYMDKNFEKLRDLGITLADTVEECTHYVTGKPSRTEFFLCCVAAGKWVLAPSFLEETLREGRIVSEEVHEWCPDIAKAAHLRSSVRELVKACGLQRRRVTRCFASWRVVLCCATESRTKSFFRVLQCGGCSVIFSFSPSELVDVLARDPCALDCVDFILSDDDLWDASQLDSVAVRMPVFRMEYIAHCLCVEKTKLNKYILQANYGSLRKRSKNDE